MEPAQAGFQKIVADILRRAPAEDAVGIAWQLACGKTVAGRTEVVDFREGTLRVRVPDDGWRSNLASFVPRYIDALNTMLSRKVEKIEFVLAEQTDPPRVSAA